MTFSGCTFSLLLSHLDPKVTSQLKHPTPFHLEAKRKQQLQEQFVPARDETGSLGHSPHLGSSPSNFPYNQGVSPNFQSKLLQEDSGTLLSAAGGMNDGAYVGAATGGQDQFSDYFNSPPPSLEHQLPQDSPIPPFLGHSDGRGLEEFLEGVNSDYGAWNLSSTVSEDRGQGGSLAMSHSLALFKGLLCASCV